MPPNGQLEKVLREWVRVFMHRSMHEFKHAMDEFGMSMSQLSTLMHLHYRGTCPISAIGDEMGISTPAASQMVDRLFNQGLLERGEHPEDRRIKQIKLTNKGRSLIHKGIEARLSWMKDLATALSPEELENVLVAIPCLTRAAQKLDEEKYLAGAIPHQKENL